MDANDFLAKLKANGDKNDLTDLTKVYEDYKTILSNIKPKEKGIFSLNVLCLLCRNIDKIPTWRETIDSRELLLLTIDCVRETRGLAKTEQVKTLACVYHIHRHVVKKNSSVPPELILKLSFMPFQPDSNYLLNEYFKTYWNILVDRLAYLERLRDKSLHKLIPKLTEDILKIIEIYDTSQFCNNVLVFLVKKLHFMFNETCFVQLNVLYSEIYTKIQSKNDLDAFKNYNDNQIVDLYKKYCDCMYVIAENASKSGFKDSVLSLVVRVGLTLLGHRPEVFHCLQTFFLNGFCDILDKQSTYSDSVFKNLTTSCEITKKLGYKTIMVPTYGYLNQFLRLFIEYSVNNSIKTNFSESVQHSCLNFMLKILENFQNSEQILKCENCKVKSGYHDALRLSFLVKHFITSSVKYKIDITSLVTLYNNLITKQYEIISILKELGCSNHEKCFRKLQTDTHNTAILLNKSQIYEFSIQLFEIYIQNELTLNSEEVEFKNIARAFYNKSICELDNFKHENALVDAFLSLVFSGDLSSDKYMSLVMDIKAKALKLDENNEDNEINNELQMMSVLDACRIALEKNFYKNLKAYLKNLKFSTLLKHEYEMYAKLWPSILPVAGVWKGLHNLLRQTEKWTIQDDESTFWTLIEVITNTPYCVRTIHKYEFKFIVEDVLTRIVKMDATPDVQIVHIMLLFLQTEYDLAAASDKYSWKTDTTTDPDNIQYNRTLSQEFDALRRAFQALELLTSLQKQLTKTKSNFLRPLLHISEIFVQHLLHFRWTAHALQLAHICCNFAQLIDDKESFVRSAGVLLYHIDVQTDVITNIYKIGTKYCTQLMNYENSVETALMFICDAAIHFKRCGKISIAAKLVQYSQANVLNALNLYPNVNLDLAIGRLLEAQYLLCPDRGLYGLSRLTAVTCVHRQYLASGTHGNKYVPRRARSTTIKSHTVVSTLVCTDLCATLGLRRRAKCSCLSSFAMLTALWYADVCANTLQVYNMEQTQVKIDNRLKHIMGLQSSNDISVIHDKKVPEFVPKLEVESMRDRHRSQTSPTRKYIKIPGYKTPEFLLHKNCLCYACSNMYCILLSYKISGLEAKMYFKNNENELASNFYSNIVKSFQYFDKKLDFVMKSYAKFESFISTFAEKVFRNEFDRIKVEILIEAALFEMKNNNFDNADEYIVNIHEILLETKACNEYLNSEVLNLMVASSKLKNKDKKQQFDLEIEFENLKLSPKDAVLPKTPENKTEVPKFSAKKVKEEEVPKKRKVIKLNLDEGSSDEKEQKPRRKPVKSEFKIPVPVLPKPVLETMTPRGVKKIKDVQTPKAEIIKNKKLEKPEIKITDTSSRSETPITKDTTCEFFTPLSTPDQFFTPLNTMKTYSKSLRRGIVKNLEQEFSTPKLEISTNSDNPTPRVEKENVKIPPRSGRGERERALRRAVSPGKLTDEKKTRRLRQPKLDD